MTICNYIYCSGLRVPSGAAWVIIDGERHQVVRNGKGRARKGEITLKDISKRLGLRDRESVQVTVSSPAGEWRVDLDPSAAMGRTGRSGDFVKALSGMSRTERVIAAIEQVRTLPYSKKTDRKTVTGRLAAAVECIDDLDEMIKAVAGTPGNRPKWSASLREKQLFKTEDPGRFGEFADAATFDRLVGWFMSGSSKYGVEALARLAGPRLADRAWVGDDLFYKIFRGNDKYPFLQHAMDRLSDEDIRPAERLSIEEYRMSGEAERKTERIKASDWIDAPDLDRFQIERLAALNPMAIMHMGAEDILHTEQWLGILDRDSHVVLTHKNALLRLSDPSKTPTSYRERYSKIYPISILNRYAGALRGGVEDEIVKLGDLVTFVTLNCEPQAVVGSMAESHELTEKLLERHEILPDATFRAAVVFFDDVQLSESASQRALSLGVARTVEDMLTIETDEALAAESRRVPEALEDAILSSEESLNTAIGRWGIEGLPVTLTKVAESFPEVIIIDHGGEVEDEVFMTAAREFSEGALYYHPARLAELDPVLFKSAALESPHTALEEALDQIDDDLFVDLANVEPDTARERDPERYRRLME